MPKKFLIFPVNTSVDDYYDSLKGQTDKKFHGYKPRFPEQPMSEKQLADYNTMASQAGGDFADSKSVTNSSPSLYTIRYDGHNYVPIKNVQVVGDPPVTCFEIALVLGAVAILILAACVYFSGLGIGESIRAILDLISATQ